MPNIWRCERTKNVTNSDLAVYHDLFVVWKNGFELCQNIKVIRSSTTAITVNYNFDRNVNEIKAKLIFLWI